MSMTELPPFLPQPEPVGPPPPDPKVAKARTTKTLLLWVLLILMFLAIWQVLNPSEPHASQVAERAPAAWSWAEALPFVLVVAFIAFVFWWLRRGFTVSRGFNAALEAGRVALAEGRPADAASVFSHVAAAHAKQPAYETIALTHLASAELQAGHIDEAIQIDVRIEKGRRVPFSSGPRAAAAAQLAWLYALAGSLDAAAEWLKAARDRLAKTQDDRFVVAAHLCLAEAALALRRGDAAACIAQLDARWPLLRGAFVADTMRVVEVVRALAESAGGLRASNTAPERLLRVEPVAKGELAWLGQRWPEMNAFLAAHGLA